MRRILVVVGACCLLSGAASRPVDADDLVADQIKHLNALADALEKKDDAASRTALGWSCRTARSWPS
jgi:outer membrane murein-binding lipoprotein Lpp